MDNGINTQVAGAIIAGGESRRFDMAPKGLQTLAGKPLIEHVINRFKPQVKNLFINGNPVIYGGLGLNCIADITPPFQGPLAGLYSCLQFVAEQYPDAQWLALAPCDTPFLPHDLVDTLINHSSKSPIRCISLANNLQPTLSLWQVSLLPLVKDAVVNQRIAGFKQFLTTLQDSNIEWSSVEYNADALDSFMNINTPADLKLAHTRIN